MWLNPQFVFILILPFCIYIDLRILSHDKQVLPHSSVVQRSQMDIYQWAYKNVLLHLTEGWYHLTAHWYLSDARPGSTLSHSCIINQTLSYRDTIRQFIVHPICYHGSAPSLNAKQHPPRVLMWQIQAHNAREGQGRSCRPVLANTADDCWWRDDEWGEGVDGQQTALLQLRLSRLRASGPNSSMELILQEALRHILAIIYKSSQLAALTAALSVFMCHSDHISRSYVDKGWSQTASRADPYPAPPHHGDPRLHLDTLVSLETDSSGEEGIEETIVYLWTLRNFCGLQEAVAFHNI